ncbi:MAG: NUDIX hydrolase [Nitrososphaerota archaeon]|nr:NUDIX hydrolase [Nitrososphaerota archaeon]
MRPPPRIYVGAGALVHRGGRLLLVKRNERPNRGMWFFPGGEVELGETTEEAAVRELREETGLRIEVEGLFDVITYLPSESWPSTRNQYVIVDYLAKPGTRRVRLNHESSDYGWFTPTQVRKLRTTESIKLCAEKFARMRIR